MQSHPDATGRIHDQRSTFLELACQVEGLGHVKQLQQPDNKMSSWSTLGRTVQELQIESIFLHFRGSRKMASNSEQDHILQGTGIDTSGITTIVNLQQVLPLLWTVFAGQCSSHNSNP